MRRKTLPFILGAALSIAAIAPAAAAPTAVSGASGLVNVVVQAVLENVDILNNSLNDVVEVNIDDSLNNALQNVLQNARIANGLEVTIQNVLNDLNVTVSDIEIEVLDNGDIAVTILGGTVQAPITDTIVLG